LSVIPRRGRLIAGVESPALAKLLPRAFCPVVTFGLLPGADWRALDLRRAGDHTRFRLEVRGRDEGEFALALQGDHNVRNALAAFAIVDAAGVPPSACRDALAAFGGVKRRLEVRGRVGGVTVYDDFAHHPTAVKATLDALRGSEAAGDGRLFAVFEPRSYTSRTRVFQEAFATAFASADEVLVAAAHLPQKVPVAERLSEVDLVSGIESHGRKARFEPTVEGLVARLAGELRAGDRVAILSNGGFGGLHDRLLTALGARLARDGRL